MKKIFFKYSLIFIISSFMLIYVMKYIRQENGVLLEKPNGSSIKDLLNYEWSVFSLSVMLIFVILPIVYILGEGNPFKVDKIVVGLIVVLDVYLISHYSVFDLKIDYKLSAIIHFNLYVLVWLFLEFITKFYNWLWETSYIKGNKVKRKYERLDVKKLSLLWAIIIFILGILFK